MFWCGCRSFFCVDGVGWVDVEYFGVLWCGVFCSVFWGLCGFLVLVLLGGLCCFLVCGLAAVLCGVVLVCDAICSGLGVVWWCFLVGVSCFLGCLWVVCFFGCVVLRVLLL